MNHLNNWAAQLLLFGYQNAEGAMGPTGWEILVRHLFAAVIFSVIGLVVFVGSLLVCMRFLPNFQKEIFEDQNTSLGIIVGSVVIGISLIIAAAITG